MTTKDVIGRAVEVVTFLLAGFSGFLKKIAPPDETGAPFAVGVASFAALLAFLFVSALARGRLRRKRKKYWYIVAAALSVVFLVSSFVYQNDRSAYTFLWPPNADPKELYVVGDTLTQQAQFAKNNDPGLTPAKLVAGFGGIDERTSVWTADSIRRVGRRLSLEYVLTVLTLAATIFCLTEGLLLRVTRPPRAAAQNKVHSNQSRIHSP